MSVVGVPKSIDNDVLFVDRTFGFDSAVEAASQVRLGGGVGRVTLESGKATLLCTLTPNPNPNP